ncbi:MAG: hypothetical protein HYX71_07455 [Opitutae bacterium]|nr:hypothetical protein [Opitutae bacterium]
MAGDHEWKGTCGFAYVATGELFFREAAEAARHLRAANPAARVCLIADKVHGEKFWDDLVLVERPNFDFRDKLLMALCPYERFVYLDTDTHVAGDLSEMFALLERYDVIGHQLFEGHDYRLPEVPDAFPEFNGGVFGFRRGPAVERFFARWLEIYAGYRARLKDGAWNYSDASDQKGFRLALYESGLRHSVLGPEFDFIVQHLQFACARVKILHGRPWSEVRRIERIVNAQLGPRAWVPLLDACVHQQLPLGGWATVARRAALQVLRGLGRKLLPAAVKDRLRGSGAVRRAFLRNEETPSSTVEHKRKWGLDA